MRLLRVKGSPVHVSTPFRAGHQARYPASYPPAIREEFPVVRPAVSCCLSAAGVRFLDTLSCQTGFRPPCGRPTAGTTPTRACAADPGRVYTFRTCETRTGLGALSTPGTTVFAGHRLVRGRRLPPYIGRSLFTPEPQPNPGCGLVEASARVSLESPRSGSFPSPVAAMVGSATLGFSRELRTRPIRNRPRTSRWGQVEHRPFSKASKIRGPP